MEYNIYNITSLDDERVAIYTKYNEPQLMHFFEPDGGIFIAETPMVIERALDMGAVPVSFFIEEGELQRGYICKVIDKAYSLYYSDIDKTGSKTDTKTYYKNDYKSDGGSGNISGTNIENRIDIYTAKLDVIQKVTGYNLTRGMLAAFRRPVEPDISEFLKSARNIAVLENVVNPTNLGAIFRSAAALGVDFILITEGSTDPYYRRAARVSMGTVFQIPWAYIPKNTDFVDMLHKYGYTVTSMALKENAVKLNDPVLKKATKKAIVMGTEGTGISEEVLMKSDHIVIIPMYNGVDSLNVAASSAVAFWELCRS
ncbi:tRNA G18 (ribose-2'-O)-methylase SpoU [Eubacterium ruminantium]|nr:tRNA G18 (ribose-2'-O)-methylase SpoU [Eubacterium ruminantium]